MSKGLVFWLVMIIAIIFALIAGWPGATPGNYRYTTANSIVVWILLFILGWAVFGFVIQ